MYSAESVKLYLFSLIIVSLNIHVIFTLPLIICFATVTVHFIGNDLPTAGLASKAVTLTMGSGTTVWD